MASRTLTLNGPGMDFAALSIDSGRGECVGADTGGIAIARQTEAEDDYDMVRIGLRSEVGSVWVELNPEVAAALGSALLEITRKPDAADR